MVHHHRAADYWCHVGDWLMDQTEIAQRIAERQSQPAPTTNYQHIVPFSQAGHDLVDTISNTEGRWMFGITEIDTCTRGLGKGELMYVSGRSHSGKTQVVLQSIVNGDNPKVLLFTPDEVAELVLTKLIGITRGMNAEDLERRIKQRDAKTIDMVHRVAADEFSNLRVVDRALTFDAMSVAMQEAEDSWGGTADAVVVDYLELLPGDAEHGGVVYKSQQLKAWTKEHAVPMVALRQNSRSSASRGKAAGISGMSHGGENEALIVLEVYRKMEDPDLTELERSHHATTVTVGVVKNKRPPSRKGAWDLYIDPDCGLVRSLRTNDNIPLAYGNKPPVSANGDRSAAPRPVVPTNQIKRNAASIFAGK